VNALSSRERVREQPLKDPSAMDFIDSAVRANDSVRLRLRGSLSRFALWNSSSAGRISHQGVTRLASIGGRDSRQGRSRSSCAESCSSVT
jgi:hypothetical protein